jgi:hypothetical protein
VVLAGGDFLAALVGLVVNAGAHPALESVIVFFDALILPYGYFTEDTPLFPRVK